MIWAKKLFNLAGRYVRRKSIQFMISISFTLVSVFCMLSMGVLLYAQSSENTKQALIRENQQLVSQMALSVTNYTRSMLRVSDTMYYSVIKNADLEQQTLENEMNLLYSGYKDSLVSVACFTETGDIVGAAPIGEMKVDVDVAQQEWFTRAVTTMENQHFSTPHVQNLFEDSPPYRWVISLSRMVELTYAGNTTRGVLLVDMNYSGIEQIFTQMSSGDSTGYAYLIDSSGEIIYHPQQRLIYSGLLTENNVVASTYTDGVHEETFEGSNRQIIVKSVGYTGWKVVSVIPNTEFNIGLGQMQLFAIAVIGFAILLLIIMNTFVSSRVADPIKKLDQSVRELEKGNLDLDIYIGGPYEIEHLGKTIRSVVDQMRALMDDIVKEQEDKRRTEFDALQAQINPHFLYNTLDSIVWMIESDNYKEAISMVTALANLFRISLSKGSNIIPLRAELQHASYYLHIQNIRYKNKFTVRTFVDPEIKDCYTIKLVVQPLLENAIYHAMELMDGDGEITINGYRNGEHVYIEVKDNGLGIPKEKLDTLLTGSGPTSKKGSGIGLRNVHQRIRLYYGEEYGLEVESELDVGTTVRIHLPYAEKAELPLAGEEPATT